MMSKGQNNFHNSRDGCAFVASSMPRRQYGSGGAWAPGGLCVQGGVFDSLVVLSAVSGSVGGGVGWSGPLWSCMGCDMGSSGGSVGCACDVS